MSVTQEQFHSLNDLQKWELYSKASIDRAAFDNLSEKLTTTINALQVCENNINSLDSQLKVSTAVNKKLNGDVKNLQKRVNDLDQYSRRENVVVTNVTEDIQNEELEQKMILLFYKAANHTVRPCDITACHRMKKKSSVIVRFANRKDAVAITKKSRSFGNSDTTGVWGENVENNVFPNLTPLNLRLRFVAKKMKGKGHIWEFGSSVHGVWIRANEGDDKRQVSSEDDFSELLPEGTDLSTVLV